MYEMSPPDLMDYDVCWIIAIQMLPEWNKSKEDSHWNEVRRRRKAALRYEEDSDLCVIM